MHAVRSGHPSIPGIMVCKINMCAWWLFKIYKCISGLQFMVSFCVSVATAATTGFSEQLSSYKTQVILAEQLYCDLPIK